MCGFEGIARRRLAPTLAYLLAKSFHAHLSQLGACTTYGWSLSEVKASLSRRLVPGGGRIGRQEERVGQLVAVVEAQRLQVDRQRHQHHAVEKDVVPLLQVQAQARRARRSVAFADQVLGRVPAAEACEVQADEV